MEIEKKETALIYTDPALMQKPRLTNDEFFAKVRESHPHLVAAVENGGTALWEGHHYNRENMGIPEDSPGAVDAAFQIADKDHQIADRDKEIAELRRQLAKKANPEPTKEEIEKMTLPHLKKLAKSKAISLPDDANAEDPLEYVVRLTDGME